MNTLLHTHAGEDSSIWIEILDEVLLHGFLDTLKIIPFLFFTYLLMEFIEHKASDRVRRFMKKSGAAGPCVGGLLGAVPQCGFSAAAANFYTCRVITLGTVVAIFLSTSDEMLPIMLSGRVSTAAILAIIGYKVAVGTLVGFALDIILRITKKDKEPISIDDICDKDGCHCERGIVRSAIHHTLTIGVFILIVTFIINALVLFIGTERISDVMYDKPIISHLIAAIIGLIPNCASSVLLTNFCISGFITVGTMISGLFSGAGVGLLILFKVNKRLKENVAVLLILIFCGVAFGFLADVLNFSALI